MISSLLNILILFLYFYILDYKMNIGALKKLILVFSSAMFIYQASVAIRKLMNPPVIESTQRFSIANIDAPLITICPLNQYNYTKFKQLGYEDEVSFMLGRDDYESGLFVGWDNLTFNQIVPHVINFNLSHPELFIFHKNYTYEEIKYEINFLPLFGMCFDLVNITITKEFSLYINLDAKVEKAKIFITDRNMKTRHTVYADSHWGSRIVIQQGME